ncbi:AAA family ATPase [Xanthobacter pseudotagetidis]|uniref:AAA family ATPase n=1 Tax=Xanthobacter pseudotagetidis TaxID=3119911 RepID=UPI00372CD405
MKLQPAVAPADEFQRHAAAGFLAHLIPVIPANATLSDRSSLAAAARGKAPGEKGVDGKWRGLAGWAARPNATAADIREWAGWGANIGLRTGRIVAFDLDVNPERAQPGEAERLRAFAAELPRVFAGALGVPLKGLPTRTRGGSVRAVFARTEIPRAKMVWHIDATGQKIELLGTGQQIVVAGSHPSGEAVENNLCAVGFDGLPMLDDAALSRCESAVREMGAQHGFELRAGSEATSMPGDPKLEALLTEELRHSTTSRAIADPEAEAEFADLDHRFGAACEANLALAATWTGERPPNDPSGSGWLDALAFRLGAAGGFDHVDFARLVARWDHEKIDQDRHGPDSDSGRRQIVRAWLHGGAKGAEVRTRRQNEADPSRWLDSRSDGEASAEKGSDQSPTRRLQWTPFDAAADGALTDSVAPLIKGLLDQGAMTVLYGESNVGKTFVAMDIAHHVATGRSWGGMKTTRLPVVYVAAEGGRGAKKRAAALRLRRGDPGDLFRFLISPVDLLRSSADLQPLVTMLRELPQAPGLIVVDTLSRAMAGGDENSSTDMGAMVKHLDALRSATGAHVLVVHHSGKDTSKGARGHSLLRAATDTEIEIQNNRIMVTKQRDLDRAWSSGFSLDVVELGRDADGDPVTSCVVVFDGRDGPALPRDQLDRIRAAVGDLEWGPRDSGRGSGNAEWIGVPVAEALGLDLSKRNDKARTKEQVVALLRCGAFREIERERRKRIVWGSAPSSPDQWCDSSPSSEDAPPNLFD